MLRSNPPPSTSLFFFLSLFLHFSKNTPLALSNLYHTFIYPYLIYCVEIWCSTKNVHLSPVMLLQKKIVRTITISDRLAHTEPLFLNLDILPIDKLIQNRIGLFMYKIFYGLHPIGISAMYSQNCDVHSHDTTKKNNLHVTIGHSDLYVKKLLLY